MDTFLDILWEHIATGLQILGNSFFALLEPLHILGPALLIGLLAFGTVALTKMLKPWIITKRYKELEKNFQHWLKIREEALKCDDTEKGKRMARNIDKAELNKAYYDYFFEGFMLGLARKVMPIFFMFGFINEFYRPERMIEYFGREYVLQIPTTGSEPLLAGAIFWYVASLFCSYLLWFAIGRIMKKTHILSLPAVKAKA